MNRNRKEALFARALEKPADNRAVVLEENNQIPTL
jgi:hypothetical protein